MNDNTRPSLRYIRLLSYENACKVIDFIRTKDSGKLEDNYANITTGGVSTLVKDEDWQVVINYLDSLNVRYEITTEPPYKVEKEIVDNLKKEGVI